VTDTGLRLEKAEQVAVLTLHNPEKLNALTAAMRAALGEVLAELARDDAVRALVITGAGRGFCSGVDLTGGPAAQSAGQNVQLDEYGWVGRQAISLYELDKPIIAAVNGVSAGAGMSLALACDLRVGSDKTRFKTVFIERNLTPDSGMSFFLPRIVGYSRAADLIYTSRAVDADEALRIGLLDRLFPHATLVDDAIALAREMTQWPPLALRMSKRVLQHNVEEELRDALKYETHGLSIPRKAKGDAEEARKAFLEKRRPSYTGT